MEDYEYLYLLKTLVTKSQGRPSILSQRTALLSELNEKVIPNFTDHTRDVRSLTSFRRRMGEIIARLIG